MLKNPKYAFKLKDILIKDYSVNPLAFICEGYNVMNEAKNEMMSDKEEEKMISPQKNYVDEFIGKKRSGDKIEEKNNKMSLSNISEIIQSTIPYFDKLDIKLNEDLIADKANCLNFELFCLKWERMILLTGESLIELNKFFSIINLLTLISKTKMNIVNSYAIGSYHSKTMRLSNKEIDYLVEFSAEITPKMYQEFISNSFNESIEKELKLDYINEKTTRPYIRIENKNKEICKVFFVTKEEAKNLKSHVDFIEKSKITVEQEIAIKFIKQWRRCNDLNILSSEVIEFIVLSITYESIYEIILAFFEFIATDFNENNFFLPYQKTFIAAIKQNENYAKLSEIAKNAIDNFKTAKFSQFFTS